MRKFIVQKAGNNGAIVFSSNHSHNIRNSWNYLDKMRNAHPRAGGKNKDVNAAFLSFTDVCDREGKDYVKVDEELFTQHYGR